MQIKQVLINKFRNIQNKEFVLNGNTSFVGNNRLGKTNVLNAISWCLTGYDLNGKSSNIDNVPFDISYDNGDVVIDVSVNLDGTIINRLAVYCDKKFTTKLLFDGVETKTLKEGEAKIDELLGIIQLTTLNSKDFNVRRFLLNPLYLQQCKESAFREFIIKQLINVDPLAVYDTLPDSYKKLIDRESVECLSQNNDKAIKGVKAKITYWENVIDFLEKNIENQELFAKVLEEQKQEKAKLVSLTDKNVAIDKYALELSKVYQNACNQLFKDIEITLLQKGQGEDVWKDCCLVKSNYSNIQINYCSTSEQIITGCKFIYAFAKKYKDIPKLPLIFDELETLDSNSIIEIQNNIDNQLISACVVSGIKEIKVGKF